MSKNINVNPGHYKVAGRERQGEDVLQQVNRQAFAQQHAEAERWQARPNEGTPGWEDPAQPLAEPKPPRRAPARRTKAKAKAKSTSRTAAKRRPRQAKRRASATRARR